MHSYLALVEGAKAALNAIAANAMRSALTCLGIIIGVASVIAIVGVMQGFSQTIRDQLKDMAPDVVNITPRVKREQMMLGIYSKLNYQDFDYLKHRIKHFDTITATMHPPQQAGVIQFRGQSHATRLIGVEHNFDKVYRVYPEYGRFLMAQDDDNKRPVAFIGQTLINQLSLPDNPVGEYIQVNQQWFKVIGVAEPKGNLLGHDQDDLIYLPLSQIKRLAQAGSHFDVSIMYRAKAGTDSDELQQKIARILRKRHGLKDDKSDDFEFKTAEKFADDFNKMTGAATAITAGIVGVSLLVGGIGVMNIMLVSVTERTRVIGTLKALGATPHFIMLQFLVEAVLLSLFGGMVGIGLGYGIASLLTMMIPNMPAAFIPLWAIALSFGVTSFIGVVFGFIPALKAARLKPIEALRYE